MSTRSMRYQKIRKKLMAQLRKCRDRDIRVKVELILYALKLGNITLACERLGFGRSFYYKWWGRLSKAHFRLRALKERSRRPRHTPHKLDGYLESRIAFYRRKGYGAEMIQEYLQREGQRKVSTSTIHHVLNKRRPAVKKKKNKLKKHRRRYELVIPGQRLQVDVKYSPMKVGGKTVYIYVAIDECTRWRFAYTYEELNEVWTIDFLDRLIKASPFPIWCIQTDNGIEFTFDLLPGNTRKHLMDEWCEEHGINHRLIPPGMKELNGKVERSHRIDADYFYGSAPCNSIKPFNVALTRWIRFYNTQRPHGGLGYQTPMEKLRERITGVSMEHLPQELEPLRQKFLRDGPRYLMSGTKKQLLALDLGKDLSDIKKAS